jgi:tripartite-type tricarboxylate transporter receptor subunit TctC
MFYFRKLKENSGTTIAKQKVMETQKVKTCFTITYTQEQYVHAKAYVDDMKKHPQRVFWQGKEKKSDDELVIEQIAHRILSGFYNDDPFNAGRHIMRMDSMVTA